MGGIGVGDAEQVKLKKLHVGSHDAGLPGGSDSKESACNAGDQGSIPGSGRPWATEEEMIGWDHRLNGHECEHAQGDSEGQSRLACRGPWGCEESDTTEQLTHTYNKLKMFI